jgi:signal peptidase
VALWLGWAVTVAAIGALLVPTLLGYDRYVIVSGSMHGTFDRGAVVFSKAKDVSALRKGDVITYRPPAATGVTHLVTHRIAERTVNEDGSVMFRTKGDANPGMDPWTFSLVNTKQNVMKFSVPTVGYALIWLSNPHVRMVLIGIPAVVIAGMALFDLIGEPIRARRRRGLQAA